jgi:hypothetical protein
MTLSEEEARTKWCSHGHAANLNQRPSDHPIDWRRLQTCLASGCMNWDWVDPIPDPNHPRLGYCSLARRP